MARLIFISEQEPLADTRRDYTQPFVGDCIEVRESGWFPGSKVLNNPRFRIVDDDSIDIAPYLFLLEREPASTIAPRHYCRWTVDIRKLEQITARRFNRTISRGEIILATLPLIKSLASVKRLARDARLIG